MNGIPTPLPCAFSIGITAGAWHTARDMWTGTELRTTMLELAPPGAACSVHRTGRDQAPLWPGELPAAGSMSDKRLREFSAGRYCARAALADLGIEPVALPVGPGRAPVWPAGIVGSISHTDDIAIAVVARQAALRSLGIDVESSDPLGADLLPLVCRDEERIALRTTGPQLLDGAKLIFSAKESIYKCLWPLTGTFLEFHALGIRVDPVLQRFTAYSQDLHIAETLRLIRGAYRSVGGLLLSCAWLDRADQRMN